MNNGAHRRLDRVEQSSGSTAVVDRGIGSCYATIRSSMEWWAQPVSTVPDLEVMFDYWRERFGRENVSRILEVIIAEVQAGESPPYGADARVGV